MSEVILGEPLVLPNLNQRERQIHPERSQSEYSVDFIDVDLHSVMPVILEGKWLDEHHEVVEKLDREGDEMELPRLWKHSVGSSEDVEENERPESRFEFERSITEPGRSLVNARKTEDVRDKLEGYEKDEGGQVSIGNDRFCTAQKSKDDADTISGTNEQNNRKGRHSVDPILPASLFSSLKTSNGARAL